MRLTAYLMLAFCLQISAKGTSQTVTFSGSNVPLKQVFAEIKAQTGYLVFYDRDVLKNTVPVTITAKDAPLQNFLQNILTGQLLEFSIKDKNIILRKKDIPLSLPTIARADISGQVVARDGSALPGAFIRIKGTSTGTATDGEGRFHLKAEAGVVLTITFLGYQTQEVTVGASNVMRIVLLPAVNALDETVVQAYGLTSKRLNTGNIDKVKGEDLNRAPVTNPLAALQGRVAGVQITQSSGVPGSSFKVLIRGRTKFDKQYGASDEPLYIIDGIPMATGNDKINRLSSAITGPGLESGLSPFNTINMADIESIEILKDADATAIYGSRGANGVVLVTTKKAKAGSTRLNLNVQNGGSKSPMPDLLSTKEYVAMRKEAFRNDNLVPNNSNAYDIMLWDTTRDNNLPKQLIGGTANFLNAQTSLSGGTANAQYIVGGGYTRETDVYPHPNDRPNARISSHFAITTRSNDQRFNAQFTGNFTSATNRSFATDLSSALNLPPNFRLYDSVGNLAWNEKGVTVTDNPLANLLKRYTAKQDNLSANAQLSYKILPELIARVSIGYNGVTVDEVSISPIAAQNPTKSTTGSTGFGNNSFKSWIAEPQLEYTHYFGKGRFNALAGGTLQSQKNDGRNFNIINYTSDDFLGSLTGVTGTSVNSMASNLNEYKYGAFFGRANYNYDNKYIVNLSGRRDGSSRFGPNYRFSNFGAVGAAWLFSSENFMSSIPFISYGKLRGSYGVTGNDKIGDYKYLDAYSADPYSPNYQDSATLVPVGLFKPDLHWERSVKLEFGLELGFVKDRILLSAAWYKNRTSDPLVSYPLPAATGFTTIQANLNGVLIDNNGLELTINSINIRKKYFEWSTNLNLTIPKNKLVRYPNIEQSSYATSYEIGRSLNIVYLANYLGVDPKTGQGMIEDRDNSGTFTFAGDGRFMLDTDPNYYGGLQNTVRYKGFTLDFLLQYNNQMGRNWFASLAPSGFSTTSLGGIQNLPHEVLDRWQKDGDITRIPRFSTTNTASGSIIGNYNLQFSNLSYMDASYLRLKNISLYYNLPSEWVHRAKMSSVSIFMQGQNLLTFTPFKSTDPETTFLNRLPPLHTLTAGIQLNL